MGADFFELPYQERRLVSFIPRKLEGKNNQDSLFDDIKKEFYKNKYKFNVRNGIGVLGLLNPTSGVLYFLFKHFYKKYEDAKENIMFLSSEEAKNFKLPPGHPTNKKQVYVGHPRDSHAYYPFYDFHRAMFEHKYSELLRLVSCLGAKKIRIEHITGWGKELLFNAGGTYEGDNASGGTKHTNKSKSSIISEFNLNNDVIPHIPTDMIWLESESLWKEFARMRMENNLLDYNIQLEYTDDFGINAELEAKIKGAKIGIGGNFITYNQTVWDFKVEF